MGTVEMRRGLPGYPYKTSLTMTPTERLRLRLPGIS
jgi:hypothetical protein